MTTSLVEYDSDLPEIPGRQAHLKPDSYLQRSESSSDKFEVIEGRRPSNHLLVNKLRDAVDQWRDSNYVGASDVSKRLFQYWFEDDHLIDGKLFKYYFGQREAIETLVYLHEIERRKDFKELLDQFGEIKFKYRFPEEIQHSTTMDGTRQITRYFPEINKTATQDIPQLHTQRYAFKMATGSGKTMVMAMAIAWSFFHSREVDNSELSPNFLVIAPNVIVYERLRKDFADNLIFRELPLVPPEWRLDLKVILKDDEGEPDLDGTLFLTNIHQLYEPRGRAEASENANPIMEFFGKDPLKSQAGRKRSLLERIRLCEKLLVINDEAHHVHTDDLLWNQTVSDLHEARSNGLAFWLDFSATPKDQNGTYFSWIICDYPLAQAVEDKIVKQPLIVHLVDRDDPEKITKENVVQVYGEWLAAAITRLRAHEETYEKFGIKPVLFIMADKTQHADAIGTWMVDTKELGFKKEEILVIHTNGAGEIISKDLDRARELSNTIDEPGNKVKVIVSVLVLREGWNVRNVTVVLGLRPMNSSARILPEQAVGRGLRLLKGVESNYRSTLEVMGTKEFEKFVRQLEVEGVGVTTTTEPPNPPVPVEPIQEKYGFDISIPRVQPAFAHDYANLDELDLSGLPPIFDSSELDKEYSQRLRMEFLTTGTTIHETDVKDVAPPIFQVLASSITSKIAKQQGLTNVFNLLYPQVASYVRLKCFGVEIDVDAVSTRTHLRRVDLQNAIISTVALEIARLTIVKKETNLAHPDFKLSDVKRFPWRRLYVDCDKTIFNHVATYNNYESTFALFLDECPDIQRFAALATTEQGDGGVFRVDYIGITGNIRFYYPDWVAVQTDKSGVSVNWIIETKGRVWEGTETKDAAMESWCERVSLLQDEAWRYVRVNQTDFDSKDFSSFGELLRVLNQNLD